MFVFSEDGIGAIFKHLNLLLWLHIVKVQKIEAKKISGKTDFLLNMVREILRDNKKYYICEECGFAYKDKAWAEKCQDFCSKHHACSTDITRHAVQLD